VQRVTDRGPVGSPDRDPASAPVFLVGPARSGTSLLYKVLCLHPEATYISNWVARYPSHTGLASLNRLARSMPGRRRSVWFGKDSNAYVYGRKRGFGKRMFPMPVEGEPVYAACGIPQDKELDPFGLLEEGRAFRRSVSAICESSGGSVFVNKRIANNLRIPLLSAAFPDARFVALVRDGRAVALSLSRVDWWADGKLWWYGGTPTDWAEEGGDPWELCARNWVRELDVMERGLDVVPPDQVLRVSYESFVDAPLETIDRIAAFSGLPADPDWRGSISDLRFPDRNEAWRSELAPDALATITGIQRDGLVAHGYDV
jgi:sulfotransferase family protein